MALSFPRNAVGWLLDEKEWVLEVETMIIESGRDESSCWDSLLSDPYFHCQASTLYLNKTLFQDVKLEPVKHEVHEEVEYIFKAVESSV